MDATRRPRSLAQSFARSYRIVVAVMAVAVLGALTVHLGCGNRAKPTAALPPEPNAPVVRVRVIADAREVKLTAAAGAKVTVRPTGAGVRGFTLPTKSPVVLSLGDGGWSLGSESFPAGELSIESDPPGSVSVDGRPYRGFYRFVARSGGESFDVVNHVPIDDYLKGVLGGELMPEFHPEAYRAQAVIARTYAIFVARTSPESRSWDLHADVRSQMYGGVRSESAKAVAAVDDTLGQVVAYGPQGKEVIFKAYYSSCCGGVTQSAQDNYGEPAFVPFTEKSVGSRCDISTPANKARFSWGPIVVSRTELARRFKRWGQSTGHPLKENTGIKRIDVADRNSAGRPVRFAVEDARGTKYVLNGEQFRIAVGTDAPAGSPRLGSSFVTPVTEGANVRFQDGHGLGHGVGACQWCLEAQARQGVAYDAIVRDAFKGAVIVKGY